MARAVRSQTQGVKRVLYSYKILQNPDLRPFLKKSYKLSEFLYFLFFKAFPWKIQEILKNLNKCLIRN